MLNIPTMPTLLVAAVPIDTNFSILDPRLMLAIGSAELLIAEERKNAVRLLASCGQANKPFILINEHSTAGDRANALNMILKNKITAFVSDAGTPCIADPDYVLVDMCIRHGVNIRAIAASSSITAALSVSGYPASTFSFLGFPPRRVEDRDTFFNRLAGLRQTAVFLERPYALKRTLEDMKGFDRQISLSIALGKPNEQNIRALARDMLPQVARLKETFAVVVPAKL
ncbi:hypothetical protein RsTz2092_08890 [Deferribacterales bacterium RsTz2092]|nr:hypothetical protein AGMMS49941_06240 [Deferribacterales bacterium]